jgi:hypothetical protein
MRKKGGNPGLSRQNGRICATPATNAVAAKEFYRSAVQHSATERDLRELRKHWMRFGSEQSRMNFYYVGNSEDGAGEGEAMESDI